MLRNDITVKHYISSTNFWPVAWKIERSEYKVLPVDVLEKEWNLMGLFYCIFQVLGGKLPSVTYFLMITGNTDLVLSRYINIETLCRDGQTQSRSWISIIRKYFFSFYHLQVTTMTRPRTNRWHPTDTRTLSAWPPSPQVTEVWCLCVLWTNYINICMRKKVVIDIWEHLSSSTNQTLVQTHLSHL